MKIWLLTSETPVYNPGGIARYVDNFARYLAAAGHEILVFGRDEENRDGEIAPGYHYRAVIPKWELCGKPHSSPRPDDHPAWPYNVLDYWGAFSFQMAEAVVEEIRRSGPPDVIESQEYCALPYYLLQRKLTGEEALGLVPVVVNAHSPDFVIREFNEEPRYQFPHYWTGRLEKFCLHAADSVICPSAYLSRQLEKLCGNSISVRHIPLPWTDPETIQAEAEVDPGKVVFFGRLEVRKGVLRLLKSCVSLWKNGLEFRLHLIGSDTFYHPRDCSVGEWIRSRYAGWIEQGLLVVQDAMPHQDLMREVQSAAFVVIPSLWENWPNTCIEAMSLGKVVVGSTNGGQAEMIGKDGTSGFVYSWDKPGDFEQAFKVALKQTGEEREAMGEAARRRIAGICSPDRVIPERLRHFSEARRGKPRRMFPFVNRRLRESEAKINWVDAEEKLGLVSVVIPYYNLGKYLRETIASVVEADWPDVEIILVDDGSDDAESARVLEELRRENRPNLTIFRQENKGLAEARNTGVRLARGQYLLLLDADDLIERDFVRKCVAVLEKYDNVHVAYSWERYIEASHDIYPCWNFELPYLLGHNMTCPVSLMHRRTYLTFGPSKPELAYNFEDFELWINLVKNGCGGVVLPEPLCRYRVRNQSMWQGSTREQHLYLQDLIARLHPEVYEEYGLELFCLQNANGPAQKWLKPSDNSPFDEYERWSRRRITHLETEAKKWWQHSTEVEKRLEASEREKHEIWLQRNSIEKKLLELKDSQG